MTTPDYSFRKDYVKVPLQAAQNLFAEKKKGKKSSGGHGRTLCFYLQLKRLFRNSIIKDWKTNQQAKDVLTTCKWTYGKKVDALISLQLAKDINGHLHLVSIHTLAEIHGGKNGIHDEYKHIENDSKLFYSLLACLIKKNEKGQLYHINKNRKKLDSMGGRNIKFVSAINKCYDKSFPVAPCSMRMNHNPSLDTNLSCISIAEMAGGKSSGYGFRLIAKLEALSLLSVTRRLSVTSVYNGKRARKINGQYEERISSAMTANVNSDVRKTLVQPNPTYSWHNIPF